MQPKTIFPQSDVLEYAMAEASVYGSSTYELCKEFLQMKPPSISNCTMVVAESFAPLSKHTFPMQYLLQHVY